MKLPWRATPAAAALLLLPLGCQPKAPAAGDEPYRGPTLPLAELAERVNENNSRITSLVADGEGAEGGFEALLRERPEDPQRYLNGEVTILYLPPNQFRLRGNKDVAGNVFDLGTDGERFWLYLPTENQLYRGTFAGMDPEAAQRLPIRPDLILEVLGIRPFDVKLLDPPIPSLRFNPDPYADAYMVTFAEPIEDPADPPARWAIVKEVWYDRQSLLPEVVIVFDRDGRPVLRAYLSGHAPIGGEGGPMMATRYELYFPDTGSGMQVRLSELALTRRGAPRPAAFRGPQGSGARVTDLDSPDRQ